MSPIPPRSGTPLAASMEKTVAATTTTTPTQARTSIRENQRSRERAVRFPPLPATRPRATTRATAPRATPKPP